MQSYPQTKKQILNGCTKPVSKSKKLANNTYRIEYANGTSAIRFHDTDVVTFDGGKTVLNSGGFKTVSTKDRISQFSGLRISQVNGLWFVNGFDFYDGITFVNGKPLKVKNHNLKKVNKLKKQIASFVAGIDKLDKLPVPNGGDCWDCCMKTEDGKTMGDLSHSDHLINHVKENYLHGSLIVNALKEGGYRDEQLPFIFNFKPVVKRQLRKYLQRHIIDNIAVK